MPACQLYGNVLTPAVRHFPAQTYPRSIFCIYIVAASLNRGRRLKRRRMTERGAVPDNGIALERREAQGSLQGPARHGTPTPLTHLGPGSSA